MRNAPLELESLLRHERWLHRLVAQLVGPEGAQDVVQETWIAALRHPPRGEALHAWLARVARNFALRRLRSESRRLDRESLAASSAEVTATDEALERFETARYIGQLVEELAEPYRTTLILHTFDGLPAAEIAKRMATTEANVRQRPGLHRQDDRPRGDRDRPGVMHRCRATVSIPNGPGRFVHHTGRSL